MDSWLGGGVLLLVAAALWLVYLVPNWLRRSEYLATERNAVRLQQTIRVLAETAETPEAVRIESAAKARKAVAETLAARPVAVGTAPRLPLPVELDPRARAAARLRRTRLVATLIILAGVVVLGWQAAVMIAGGFAAGSTMIVAIAGLVVIGGAALQGRLGTIAKARAAADRSPGAARPARTPASTAAARRAAALDLEFDPRLPEGRGWMPQPIPQPLGQIRREAAIAAARAEASRMAAAGREETVRSAAAAARVAEPPTPRVEASVPRIAEAPAPRQPSRFAAMGVVEVPSGSGVDLDSALARRRVS